MQREVLFCFCGGMNCIRLKSQSQKLSRELWAYLELDGNNTDFIVIRKVP